MFSEGVAPELLAPPANTLRVCLHPQGLARRIASLGQYSAHLLGRLHRQAVLSADPELAVLHEELRAYPGVREETLVAADPAALLFVPLVLRAAGGRELTFFSTLVLHVTLGWSSSAACAEPVPPAPGFSSPRGRPPDGKPPAEDDPAGGLGGRCAQSIALKLMPANAALAVPTSSSAATATVRSRSRRRVIWHPPCSAREVVDRDRVLTGGRSGFVAAPGNGLVLAPTLVVGMTVRRSGLIRWLPAGYVRNFRRPLIERMHQQRRLTQGHPDRARTWGRAQTGLAEKQRRSPVAPQDST